MRLLRQLFLSLAATASLVASLPAAGSFGSLTSRELHTLEARDILPRVYPNATLEQRDNSFKLIRDNIALIGYLGVRDAWNYLSTVQSCTSHTNTGNVECVEAATMYSITQMMASLLDNLSAGINKISGTATYASGEMMPGTIGKRSCPYTGSWTPPEDLTFNNNYGISLTTERICDSTWTSDDSASVAILGGELAYYIDQYQAGEMQFTFYFADSGKVLTRNALYLGPNPSTCPIPPTGGGCNA